MLESVWWQKPAKAAHAEILATAGKLEEQDIDRISRYETYLRLYGGAKRLSIRPWEVASAPSLTTDKLRLNVVKAAIDTVTAKVGKLRPRPTFVTSGGRWALKKRAKDLQRFCDGAYHQCNAYQLAPLMFRDAMIFGTGVLHAYSDGSRFRCERVKLWELYVDQVEAINGNPRNLFRVKYVDLDQLIALFPGAKSALMLAETAPTSYGDDNGMALAIASSMPARMVKVVEAWYRPCISKEHAKGAYGKSGNSEEGGRAVGPQSNETNKNSDFDPKHVQTMGRHTIAVEGATLLDEAYPYESFPFTFYHWTEPVEGFWGMSAIDDVVGLQVEINKLLQMVQRSMHLVGKPWVFTYNGNGVRPQQVGNDVAQIFEVTGQQEPKVQTFQSVNPQILTHLWELYAKAFEILGSNQLAASATAPPGLESGRALERLSEEHSERFMTASRAFEFAIGDQLAQQLIRTAKQLDESVGGLELKAADGKGAVDLKWADVEIDNDGFILQVFQTSTLPTHPSGRVAELERLQQAQIIDATEFRRLLDMPDLERSTDLATAALKLIEWQLDQMLTKEKQAIPLPYQDLDRAMAMAQNELQLATIEGAPDAATDLVRNYLTALTELIATRDAEQIAQAQQAMQMQQATAAQQGQ